jgi:Zn-finger nucleic acid-binding protein
MDVKTVESVVLWKLCPTCTVGMVHEAREKVFICNHSGCGAVFDLSALSDATISMLLQKERKTPGVPGQP